MKPLSLSSMSSSLLRRLIKSSSDSMAVVVGVAGRAGPGLGDLSGFVAGLLAGGDRDLISGEALRFLFRGGVVVTWRA